MFIAEPSRCNVRSLDTGLARDEPKAQWGRTTSSLLGSFPRHGL